ncbi:MAG: hypothetical protein A2724_13865 [Fluviicola sp. RIFCSPHIGHO2_01_FULL_43_53]|nr:MAG: hypothetical protein CHH17_02435 [Candidatus Fluviicola riflensis]OGS82866.1 MAG: hypothetical protein A2724_13865 [Fluviicola sp. RIFCSPHIGHO2_01_FULL_43_53]
MTMDKYKFSISIPAASQKEAHDKAQALAIFAGSLDAKTLTALANVVQNDPAKINFAKKFLGI